MYTEDERSRVHRSRQITARFAVAAAATGAVPVPAVSAAIVAENAALLIAISGVWDKRITTSDVIRALGLMGSVNLIGRALFIELARAMGWAAGPLGMTGVSILGATTASVQTWVVGEVGMVLARHGGEVNASAVSEAIRAAKWHAQQSGPAGP